MRLLTTLLALIALCCRLGFAQHVTAISQAPGFTSLSQCAQNIAVAVIDDSNSPECPGGSLPHCFCGAEAASQEYSDQISTNILNSCLTSPRPEATQAASVFAAYCSLGDATTTGTTAASTAAAGITATATGAKMSSLTSLSSSYFSSLSSSEARTSTAQGGLSTSTSTSGPTSSTKGGGGLDTSDIVALAVGIPGTLGTIVGAYFAYKTYKKRSPKSKQHT